MRNIKSEILFNRVLLWMILAYLALDFGGVWWMADALMAIYEMWKSFKAWEDE